MWMDWNGLVIFGWCKLVFNDVKLKCILKFELKKNVIIFFLESWFCFGIFLNYIFVI